MAYTAAAMYGAAAFDGCVEGFLPGRADVALYEAKRAGRNRVVVFDGVRV